MSLFAAIVIVIVALIHVYILVLEMFFWDKPLGQKAFGLKADFARSTKVLAANQGLYNGFLAAGLFWSVWLGVAGLHVALFFLLCVLIAGIYGAITSSRKILFVQAVPAAVGIVSLLIG